MKAFVMAIKAVFFDFDGTLANTDPIHLAVFADLFSPLGIDVDEKFFKKNISGGANKVIFQKFYPDISEAEAIEMGEKKEEEFRNRIHSLQPIAGLEQMLIWSEENKLFRALVTNAPKANIEHLLPVLHLENSFDFQITGDDIARGKPDPDPYLAALDHFHINPADAVVFEDSKTGVQSATRAGIFTFALTTTHTVDELKEAGADTIIHDYTDSRLWTILQQKVKASCP